MSRSRIVPRRTGRADSRVWRIALGMLLAAAALAVAAAPPVEALRARVEALRANDDARIGAGSIAARNLVAALYERRGFTPLWADEERARRLQADLQASATHGLDPRDYHAQALAHADEVERELLLTDAFIRLAYHLSFGKADPRSLHGGWNFARTLGGVDPLAALVPLIEAPDPAAALEGLAPRVPMYRELRDALAELRRIERAGGWRAIAAGAKLEAGMRDGRVEDLRERLRASGDLDAGADGPDFDAPLQSAFKRFQARHGLAADGVVGKSTLAALNVSVADRIAQVRVNLERLRWVARELEGDYLLVDIAGFGAQLTLDDRLVWTSRVVVGRPYRTTPVFRARMKYVVLNPEWNVPPTILREDVAPKVTRDPGYLRQHDMRVLDRAGRPLDASAIDWAQYRERPRAFPYQIVQAPGRDNPLGRIKFMFPNEHSVYLHDTPARALFEQPVRAASSGCIRIEKPLELALLLLDAREWPEDRLREAIASGRTQTVPVARAVPVLLLYFTARVVDGELQFRPDLYGRDRAVLSALAAPFRFAPVDRGGRG